jgi:hypothetical protein
MAIVSDIAKTAHIANHFLSDWLGPTQFPLPVY